MKAPALTVLCIAALCSCSANRPAPAADEDAAPAGSTAIEVDKNVSRDLEIEVAPAQFAAAVAVVTATGQLLINEDASWQVGAMTEGKIISVPVRVGDFVKQGQALAVLHSHEVHDARATYRQAKAELARQQVLADQARTVRNRTRRLFDLRAASREQLDAAETAYASVASSVAAAQADVDKARFHLTDFLEVSAEPDDSDVHDPIRDGLTIKAPASGTLMERKASAGTVVTAGDPVFTIADMSSLWLLAAVNEADLSRVRPGQRVRITVRAFPDRVFPGRVLRLGERLDAQTRTLQVRVLVPNGDGLLKPEMFANAEFEGQAGSKAIHIPEPAVQELNGKPVLFLRRQDGSFSPVEVTTGARSGGQVEIVSGLRPGDPVVVRGAFPLKSQIMKGSGD